MPFPRATSWGRIMAAVLCAVIAIAAQRTHDTFRTRAALPPTVPEAATVQAFDLGLHSAAASFYWLAFRSELPFLPSGPEFFMDGLRLVNELDPRFSTPYAFSVLVLPSARNFPGRVPAALAIGERGVRDADPDWRIPFYMGTLYQLQLRDRPNTVKYFDVAAATPGAPDYIRRFAKNYGLRPDILSDTRDAWTAVYLSSADPRVRDRAAAHIARLDILEYLSRAMEEFRSRTGRRPDDLDALVREGIIPKVPADPLGASFQIFENGLVGVAP